jgi:prevent-host-death family protein
VNKLSKGLPHSLQCFFHGYNGHELVVFVAICPSDPNGGSLMKSVNIGELKNRLSVYLNEVKAGEEILVRDRNQPVARIVPLSRSRNEDEELLALASQGKLRLGEGILDQSFWEMPAPRVSASALRRAVDRERNDD